MNMTLIWLATALVCMAFAILPAFQNEFWASTNPSIRWTILASQLMLLGAGILQGTQWPWR
jgi:CDP-diglyceride synthetase